jgi:hypothetical protein
VCLPIQDSYAGLSEHESREATGHNSGFLQCPHDRRVFELIRSRRVLTPEPVIAEAVKKMILGLNPLKKIAEDHGVNICVELLNSKRDHKDYMCDHTAWGARVVREVNSRV